jgi:hypothetical protein
MFETFTGLAQLQVFPIPHTQGGFKYVTENGKYILQMVVV